MLAEVPLYIPMPFKDVDDLEFVVLVSEENDIVSMRIAMDIGSKFRPGSPHLTGKVRQVFALLPQLPRKVSACSWIAALLGDVSLNGGQIEQGSSEISELRQSVAFLGEFFRFGVKEGFDFFVSIAPTFSYRLLDGFPERG